MTRILKEQGYISDYSTEPARVGEQIRIELKYSEERQPAISGLQRVSRPGRRRYVAHGDVPRVDGGMGTAIVSTSSGVMTGHDAKHAGVGGEVVAYVW
jgi:small subunit ribosomal protein S8